MAHLIHIPLCVVIAVAPGCTPGDPLTDGEPKDPPPIASLMEAEEGISLEDLSKGGLTAARVVAGHDEAWTSREVPYLIRLLDDETSLVWTARLGPIWSIDERTDEPTSPGELAANRLIDMHRRLHVDVTVPLVAELISNASGSWAAAEVLDRLGRESVPALRAVLDGEDEVARNRVLSWFRPNGDSLEYGPVFDQLTDEEAAEWEASGDSASDAFESDTNLPAGIGGSGDSSNGR